MRWRKRSRIAARFSVDGKGVYTATDQGSEFLRLAYIDLAQQVAQRPHGRCD
jgi:hypothetical protein